MFQFRVIKLDWKDFRAKNSPSNLSYAAIFKIPLLKFQKLTKKQSLMLLVKYKINLSEKIKKKNGNYFTVKGPIELSGKSQFEFKRK